MVKLLLAAILTSLVFVSSAAPAMAGETKAGTSTHKKHHAVKRARTVAKVAARRTHVAVAAHARKLGRVRPVRAAIVGGPMSAGDLAGLNLTRDPLDLKSNVALVVDQANSQVLFEKNSNVALPIASITKLMTGLVVVEAHQNMDEMLTVTQDDVDKEKFTSSRLKVGAQLTRANMLHIALMSSENRAAAALGRNYPGGISAFVAAMNAKAKSLGMNDTHYVDANGLSSHNVASARDLAKLVVAAHQHPILCQYSTDSRYAVSTGRQSLQYNNTNNLVANSAWDIGLQKTGFINEAGRCLVMQAKIEGRDVVMVFLDSKGKHSRTDDAGRIRRWLEALKPQALNQMHAMRPQT